MYLEMCVKPDIYFKGGIGTFSEVRLSTDPILDARFFCCCCCFLKVLYVKSMLTGCSLLLFLILAKQIKSMCGHGCVLIYLETRTLKTREDTG